MPNWSWKSILGSTKQVLWNLGLITLGSVFCAVAINGILVPKQFISGGFTGVALVLHYLQQELPLGLLYFLLNVPLFALGWKFVGRRFFLYSILGMIIFSAAIQAVKVTLPMQDYLLSALLAGIITGIGAGIILRSNGSAGGTDILSVMLFKLFSIRLGTTILAFNSIMLTAAAIVFSLEKALYTLIYLYVSSYMINLVVTGLSRRKAVYIISPQWQAISEGIMEKIERGVTVTKAQGRYTGQEVHALYTVITFRELFRLKKIIREIDPDSFMVVTDTLEVMGHRIGNQPRW